MASVETVAKIKVTFIGSHGKPIKEWRYNLIAHIAKLLKIEYDVHISLE